MCIRRTGTLPASTLHIPGGPTFVDSSTSRFYRSHPELLSRFIRFDFRPYTPEEFVAVAMHVMTRLGKPEGLARYIAEHVAFRTRDVRQAI